MYDISELYESGRLPLRYYNQLNKESPNKNYKRSKKHIRKMREDESFIMYIIENMIAATIKSAMDEIFKDFGK